MNYPDDLGYTYKKPSIFKKFLVRLIGLIVLLALAFVVVSTALAAETTPSSKPDFNAATRGTVWLLPSDGHYIEAIQLESRVNINVSGMIARAKVRQQFKNTSSLWAEGIYIFPLPDNAAVDHFRLIVDGRIIEGKIQEKQQARKTYEQAKRKGQRTGLVEQRRPNIFTTSLANIAPGAMMVVEIEYQQTLQYRDGQYQLRYPLVVGPRYITSSKEGSKNPMYDVGITSESSSKSKDINRTLINVNLDGGIELKNINSATHQINTHRINKSHHIVTLQQQSVPSDRDFILSWKPQLGKSPKAAVFNQQHDGYEYSLIQIYPPMRELFNQRDIPREVVFILDVSGSMSGTSITQAKSALKLALDRLTSLDRFNLIWFNNSAQMSYYDSQPATYDRIEDAKQFIDSLRAGGGTEMLPALKLALRTNPDPDFLRQVIFLTDGNVSNERDLFSYIESHLGENRLFTVGIGSAPNSFFMKKAAQAGRGSFTFIGDVQEVASKTNLLFRKLETPALTDITLAIDGGDIEYFKDPIPDLYIDEPLTVVVRGTNLSKAVTLHGKIGTKPWKHSLHRNDGFENQGVRTAWAREKLAGLSKSYHDAEIRSQKEDLKNEMITLSINHHLVSQYTSLVAVDVTPVNKSGSLHSERIKNNLPHGWRADKVKSPSIRHKVAQIRLPQTATTSYRDLMLALMFISIAMLLTLTRSRR